MSLLLSYQFWWSWTNFNVTQKLKQRVRNWVFLQLKYELTKHLFLLSFLYVFDSHEKCEYVMISVWQASQLSICSKNLNIAIFLDIINVINVKLRRMVVLSELTHSHDFEWPWLYSKVTAVSYSFNWRFYILIQLSQNFL